eukprot:82262-Rhodomonas_salina.3
MCLYRIEVLQICTRRFVLEWPRLGKSPTPQTFSISVAHADHCRTCERRASEMNPEEHPLEDWLEAAVVPSLGLTVGQVKCANWRCSTRTNFWQCACRVFPSFPNPSAT